MEAILLGGESLKNRAWIEQVDGAIKALFSRTKILYYDHWQTGGDPVNVEGEYPKLATIVQDLNDYLIFAKSAGGWVTGKASSEGLISPTKCIFIGTALYGAKRLGYPLGNWYKTLICPKLFIQKSSDPACSFNDLKGFLEESELENYQLVEIPGDTHHYEDLEKIRSLVQSFLDDSHSRSD